MHNKQELGFIGENIALKYLTKNNYNIIKRNFRCEQGEIDIIAQDNLEGELVFIEVKTRSNIKYGKPVEAVNIKKQKHIYQTGEYYIMENKLENILIRLDVIEVYLKQGKYRINHIKQAFEI